MKIEVTYVYNTIAILKTEWNGLICLMLKLEKTEVRYSTFSFVIW